jgi:PP-loop superfamily ATP-utilizing enzyme
MTEKYTLLMYYVHSYLERVRHELKITKDTTVENFREQPENETHCKIVFEHSLTQWNYELSYNQVANGINLLLQAWAKQNGA